MRNRKKKKSTKIIETQKSRRKDIEKNRLNGRKNKKYNLSKQTL